MNVNITAFNESPYTYILITIFFPLGNYIFRHIVEKFV